MRQNDVGERSQPAPHVPGVSGDKGRGMSRSREERNRRMLRARDAMDRTFAEPLCVRRLARIAEVSEAHFIRIFRATFGETPPPLSAAPARRARDVLPPFDERSITDICFDV